MRYTPVVGIMHKQQQTQVVLIEYHLQFKISQTKVRAGWDSVCVIHASFMVVAGVGDQCDNLGVIWFTLYNTVLVCIY